MPGYASSSAARTLPAYMRRRQTFGGPTIGMIRCTSFGPVTPTNAGLGGLILHINGEADVSVLTSPGKIGYRPLALSWSCSNTPTGSTLQMLHSISISSGATNGMIVAAGTTTVTAIDLATYPTGVVYVGDSANSSPASVYEIINNNGKYATANVRTWPETNATASVIRNGYNKFTVGLGAVAPTDLCLHFFYYFTSQVNIGADSDIVPGGRMND